MPRFNFDIPVNAGGTTNGRPTITFIGNIKVEGVYKADEKKIKAVDVDTIKWSGGENLVDMFENYIPPAGSTIYEEIYRIANEHCKGKLEE